MENDVMKTTPLLGETNVESYASDDRVLRNSHNGAVVTLKSDSVVSADHNLGTSDYRDNHNSYDGNVPNGLPVASTDIDARDRAAVCCKCTWLMLLPLFLCILFPVSFFISYGVALAYDDVNSTGDFPYISETGAQLPASCIFGELMNIAAIAVGLTVYTRYRQLGAALLEHPCSVHGRRTNIATFIIGLVMTFGGTLVANFQYTHIYNFILYVHMTGALLAFGLGCVYCWMQCYLTYLLLRFMCSKVLLYSRIVLSLIASVFLVASAVGAQLYASPHGKVSRYRLLSTTSEWILAVTIAIFFGTYFFEYKGTTLKRPKITVVRLF